MLCHRNSNKPSSELISRFQKVCGSYFFNKVTDNKHDQFTELKNVNTLPGGAQKRTTQGSVYDLFSLNAGYEPSSTVFTSMSQKWHPPQFSDFDLYPSQAEPSTISPDLVEGRGSPKASPCEDSCRFNLDLRFQGQSNYESAGDVDPSQLWNSVDSFGSGGLYSPSQATHTHHDLDYESLGLPDELLHKNGMISDKPPPGTTESISQDISIADAQKPFYSEGEQFRYLTILRTPTAMVSHPREAPVSYLNKGRVYHLTVVDSRHPMGTSRITKYRTFVRVAFEQEEQRSDPAAYWRLWKAGRGMADVQNNDTKVKAVEYVGQDKAHMSIENTGLDGFSITWTIEPNEKVYGCSIPVRFNFLSTDFTLSKGVKGSPVRLCAKTKQLDQFAIQEPEVCFCNVKLFRGHGAERKLSNDVASIHNRLEKLKRQMSEPAPSEPAIRRKRGSLAKSKPRSKPNHQKTGMSVVFENNSQQLKFQTRLQKKMDDLQKSVYTSRRESVLSFRAEEQDDPEMHLSSPMKSYDVQQQDIMICKDSSNKDSLSASSSSLEFKGLGTPNTMSSFQDEASTISSKSERATVPAACFYIRFQHDQSPREYYRAIYPKSRTVDELASKVFEKSSRSPATVTRILHVNQSGLKVVVDDDFVQRMPNGQSMVVKVLAIPLPSVGSTTTETLSEILLEY